MLNFLVFIFIFISSFILNIVWEFLHYPLYQHYKGRRITYTILTRAAVVDAFIISGVFIFFSLFEIREGLRFVLIIFSLLLIAYIIEVWALHTLRWNYKMSMPIVPFLNIGFSPFLQLAICGVIIEFLLRIIR